jgi:hypothetical protein
MADPMEPEAPVTSTVRIGFPYPLRGADGTSHRHPKTLTARPAGIWNASPGIAAKGITLPTRRRSALPALQWIVQ